MGAGAGGQKYVSNLDVRLVGKSEHCSLYIAFSRRNYYRPKSVPEIDEKVDCVRCERLKRHISMCVDVANVIAQSFHISLVNIL